MSSRSKPLLQEFSRNMFIRIAEQYWDLAGHREAILGSMPSTDFAHTCDLYRHRCRNLSHFINPDASLPLR